MKRSIEITVAVLVLLAAVVLVLGFGGDTSGVQEIYGKAVDGAR